MVFRSRSLEETNCLEECRIIMTCAPRVCVIDRSLCFWILRARLRRRCRRRYCTLSSRFHINDHRQRRSRRTSIETICGHRPTTNGCRRAHCHMLIDSNGRPLDTIVSSLPGYTFDVYAVIMNVNCPTTNSRSIELLCV